MTKEFMVPTINEVSVVGVGGTGSYLVQGLAKMIAGYKLKIRVQLIDPDVVEEKNCFRQNFMSWEVGQNKAEAMAFRIAQQFGLDFHSYAQRGEDVVRSNDPRSLLITCVDKIAPRKALSAHPLWLDCGNDLDYGQVIFGTSKVKKECRKAVKEWDSKPVISALPNAYLKVGMGKLRDKKQAASCADMPFSEQGCFVNEVAAQAALTILHQILVAGTVKTPAIWFNTSTGRWTPAKINKTYLEC